MALQPGTSGGYNFQNGMERQNGTTASHSGFYKNMIIYGMEHRNALWLAGMEPNSNPMPNLTPTLNLILTLKITVIYAVQLPNVFRKLIVTFRRVPWIILL